MNALKLALLTLAVSLTACGPDLANIGGESLDGIDAELTNPVGRFETFTGHDGKVYFHLLAANGEKVLASQGYTELASAKNGILSVKTNGVDQANYLMRVASDGSPYFVLVAGNGQIIAVSEMYSTQYAADTAVGAVMRIVANTTAEDPALLGNSHFEIFKGLDAKFYFHLKANNGEIILQSQGYTTRASAANGVASVVNNGTNAARYVVLTAADGRFFFHLRAANGQVIGKSQTYGASASAEAGITACINAVANKQ